MSSADPLTITLAPMRRRHLRAVLANERRVYPHPWKMNLFLSELARPESRSYVVARAGALIVGHCGVLYVADEGHLTTVVVAPEFQRRQIASRMLCYQMRHAVERGVRALTLEVRVSNEAARACYARFGFVPAGIRKGYYAESGEDALIMWAHDIDADEMVGRREAIEASFPGATRLDNLPGPHPEAPGGGDRSDDGGR